MTIVGTFNMDKTKIKVRWQEPYVSSAINKFLSCLPRGIYRGMTVQEMDTPGAGVKIVMDSSRGDSLILHEDLINSYKTAIIFSDDFDIEFSYTPLTEYYIWVNVDYSESSETQGLIRVGELTDLNADSNAIPIAKFNASDLTIENADITQDLTDTDTFISPRPDDSVYNYYGLLSDDDFGKIPTQDQKDAMDNADSPDASNPFAVSSETSDRYFAKPSVNNFAGPSTAVQLTGWFYVGSGGSGTAKKFFRIMHGGTDKEFLGSDDREIGVLAIYNNINTVQLDPSSDATNGFYENPYVRFDFSDTNDSNASDFDVFCGEREYFKNFDAFELIQEAFGLHPNIHGNVNENIIRRYNTLQEGIEGTGISNLFRVDSPYDGVMASGEEINSFQGTGASSEHIYDACTDGEYIFYIQGSHVRCADSDTGSEIWNYSFGARALKNIETDGHYVYVALDGSVSYDAEIRILNRNDGSLEKTCVMGSSITTNFSDIAANGKYAVATNDTYVYCWDIEAASPISPSWSYNHTDTLNTVCIDHEYAFAGGIVVSNMSIRQIVLSSGVMKNSLILAPFSTYPEVNDLCTDGCYVYIAHDNEELTAGGRSSFSAIERPWESVGVDYAVYPFFTFDSDCDGSIVFVDDINVYCSDGSNCDVWILDPKIGVLKQYLSLIGSSFVRYLCDIDGHSLLCMYDNGVIHNVVYLAKNAVSRQSTIYQKAVGTDVNRKPFYKLAIPQRIR